MEGSVKVVFVGFYQLNGVIRVKPVLTRICMLREIESKQAAALPPQEQEPLESFSGSRKIRSVSDHSDGTDPFGAGLNPLIQQNITW